MFLLVTGGSGSGKSEYAERWLTKNASPECERYYIATMMPFGEEAQVRIARHRAQRSGRGFQTIERYTNLEGIEFSPDSDILLECMSNLVANELYDESESHSNLVEAIDAGIERLAKRCHHLVVVTNEVFSDGITYDESTMQYISYLAQVNKTMAKRADAVAEIVYSIPVCLKGELD